jgi:L-serine/L-threonine ammonia-lyase
MSQFLHVNTPLIESTLLSSVLNKPVYLKLENAQPTGSFKIRGIGRLCQEFAREGAKFLVCPSGGNAGLATAYSAKKLKIPCKIVIPRATPSFLKQIIEAEGAEVIIHGDEWNSADILARQMCQEEGYFYVPPYDHPLIWEGNSTLVDEVYNTGIKPDVIILSVGGGGLLCGTIQGLLKCGWGDVPIVTAETRGADSLASSLRAKKLMSLEKITSIAVTLGCKRVADRAYDLALEHNISYQVVSDLDAVLAAIRFADDHRAIVEPACGATLSLVYDKAPILDAYRSVLVIVCGGSGVSYELLQKWHHTLVGG